MQVCRGRCKPYRLSQCGNNQVFLLRDIEKANRKGVYINMLDSFKHDFYVKLEFSLVARASNTLSTILSCPVIWKRTTSSLFPGGFLRKVRWENWFCKPAKLSERPFAIAKLSRSTLVVRRYLTGRISSVPRLLTTEDCPAEWCYMEKKMMIESFAFIDLASF